MTLVMRKQPKIAEVSVALYPGRKHWFVQAAACYFRKDSCFTLLEPFAGSAVIELSLLYAQIVERLILVEKDAGVPASLDCLILDPPYMHGGPTIKASLNNCYHNANTGHESVIRLYAGGLLEAARVLRKKGLCIVKSQDETESGKQRFSHVELIHLLEMSGFVVVDLFVMVQSTIPITRKGSQKSARKNHSYALVARSRR
jgi:hypothetical protein